MSKRIVKRKIKLPVIIPYLQKEREVAEKTKASVLKHNNYFKIVDYDVGHDDQLYLLNPPNIF